MQIGRISFRIASMVNIKWLLSIGLVILLGFAPVSGQVQQAERVSPYQFVPLDLGGFFTLDLKRFQELEFIKLNPEMLDGIYKTFTKDFSEKELTEIRKLNIIPSIQTVTFVFFESLKMNELSDEFAAVFKISKKRDELIRDLSSLDSLETIPSFRAYGDIPLMRSDPAVDDPQVYLAFPDNQHVVLGYKHEVRKILAIYRRERANILADLEFARMLRRPATAPVFQLWVSLSDQLVTNLKKAQLPLDLTGTKGIAVNLDPRTLEFRFLISDPAESTRIASYWTGLKGMLSAFSPKTEREKALFTLGQIMDVQSIPAGLNVSFPSDQVIPAVEKMFTSEMRLNQDAANAQNTVYNIKLLANQLEIYLLTHPDLPKCGTLAELKAVAPEIFFLQGADVPETDGWGNLLMFVSDGHSYSIASGGSDNVFKGWDQEPGEYSAQGLEDFKLDYIFKDGRFVLGPVME